VQILLVRPQNFFQCRSHIITLMLTTLQGDFVEGCIWSIIELDVGIICACMPSFRIILIRIFPRLGSTPDSSNPQFTTGNQSGMEVLQSNTTKSGISYSRDSGNYTMKPAQDDSNFMQCVEIRAVPEESYELVLANTTDR
jgi:hypothetical protein